MDAADIACARAHAHARVSVSVCICMCIYMVYVCVCVCVSERVQPENMVANVFQQPTVVVEFRWNENCELSMKML